MFGDSLMPIMNKNLMSCQTNGSNQLQLFGNFACGNERSTPMRFRESDEFTNPQNLQISLNYNNQKEGDPVSTGLRLSYDDEEHNSSVTSASGGRSVLFPLDDNVTALLTRQKEELERYLRAQEEQLGRGVREMKQRHVAAFVAAMERDLGRKLMEKDAEIEAMNRRNKELAERVNQVAMEAQHWHYKAQYNESVVSVLKANLQQALTSGSREGFGDSEVDDTASCKAPLDHLKCKGCKVNQVSVLLIPCRHLCLCSDCSVVMNACPVCRVLKTGSVQVLMS